jgi:hypothetical protein
MFYQEKFIDGILHFRITPKGKWCKFEMEELSKKLMQIGYKPLDTNCKL